MNPIDPSEFSVVLKTIKDEMPFLGNSTAHVKSDHGNLPKNFKLHSINMNNKFLDHNLDVIDEIEYRDKNNKFVKNFNQYQTRFTDIPQASVTDTACAMLVNPYWYVLGCETLETGNTSLSGNYGNNIVWSAKLPNGVIGCKYDQVAINIDSISSANMNLAIYDDSGGNPTNLYASTGSHSASAGFNLKSVTEFTLSTVSNWTAMVKDASVELYSNNSNVRKRDTNTSSLSVPNPYTTDATDSGELNMKIVHS